MTSKACICAFNARLEESGSCTLLNCTHLEHGRCFNNMYICDSCWESSDGGKCNKYSCAIGKSSNICGGARTCNKATDICICAQNSMGVDMSSCQCKSGWYSVENMCNKYNCSEDKSGHLCNGFGSCSDSGECVCHPTAVSIAGTCENTVDKCGLCPNEHCLYDSVTTMATCVCLPGFRMIATTCYKNNCGRCENGACRLNNVSLTVVCYCNDRYTAVDDTCFANKRTACWNGKCVTDKVLQVVSCVCDNGLAPQNGVCDFMKQTNVLKIVLPAVIFFVILLVIIVNLIVVFLRQCRKRACEKSTVTPSFIEFSSPNCSAMQALRV